MNTSTNTSTAVVTRQSVLLLLVLGPALTMFALTASLTAHLPAMNAATPATYAWVALIAWSPLPFSIPAVVLEKARDAALPGFSGLGRATRAVLLVPYMLTRSPARVEFAGSLIGLALAFVVAWPVL